MEIPSRNEKYLFIVNVYQGYIQVFQ